MTKEQFFKTIKEYPDKKYKTIFCANKLANKIVHYYMEKGLTTWSDVVSRTIIDLNMKININNCYNLTEDFEAFIKEIFNKSLIIETE